MLGLVNIAIRWNISNPSLRISWLRPYRRASAYVALNGNVQVNARDNGNNDHNNDIQLKNWGQFIFVVIYEPTL